MWVPCIDFNSCVDTFKLFSEFPACVERLAWVLSLALRICRCRYNIRMLARYKIYRGNPPSGASRPDGVRQDTRKHTRHCLRPSPEIVTEYLDSPSPSAWKKFESSYLRSLTERYRVDPTPFDDLAALASGENVYLGCSCPTVKNPDVNRCHTVLALQFMQERYPELEVEFP